MKKTILKMACLLVIGVSLVACQKENSTESITYNSPETKKNLVTIQDKSSSQEARLIFNSLTNEEKANLWRCHLASCKNSLTLNADQTILIDELIAFVKPEMYAEGESSLKRSEFLKLNARTKMLFSDEARSLLLHDLNLNEKIESGGSGGQGLTRGCRCNQSDDWCGYTDPINFWQCVNGCAKRKNGCGTFWIGECNGLCIPVKTFLDH